MLKRMADSTRTSGLAVPMAAFAAGAVVALLVGVFGRVHDPTLAGTTTLGFRTVIDMKVAATVAIAVLAVLQLLGGLWMYGRLGLAVPSWLGTAHRVTGATTALLVVFVCVPLPVDAGRGDRHVGGRSPRDGAHGRARAPGLRRHRGIGREGGRGAVQARTGVVPARGRRPALRPPHRRGDDLGALVRRCEGLAGVGWLALTA